MARSHTFKDHELETPIDIVVNEIESFCKHWSDEYTQITLKSGRTHGVSENVDEVRSIVNADN